jgi:hypothetical protein
VLLTSRLGYRQGRSCVRVVLKLYLIADESIAPRSFIIFRTAFSMLYSCSVLDRTNPFVTLVRSAKLKDCPDVINALLIGESVSRPGRVALVE